MRAQRIAYPRHGGWSVDFECRDGGGHLDQCEIFVEASKEAGDSPGRAAFASLTPTPRQAGARARCIRNCRLLNDLAREWTHQLVRSQWHGVA